MKCKNCNEKNAIKYSKYSNGLFCSRKCARSFSTRTKRKEINEKVSIKLKKKNYCKSCQMEIFTKNKYCSECNKIYGNIKLFKKININDNNLKIANEKALKKLKKLYFIENLSLLEIKEKYKIQTNTMHFFFKKNNINLKTLSEGISLAIKLGKLDMPDSNQYKSGWFKSWTGENFYLRSSYEFKYAKMLNENKIKYSVEKIRLEYFDTQQNKNRIAIPDFYLIDENKIIEIKSEWTLDEVNMKDKEKSYIKNGYNFELIIM